jgi:hypothetical protein
MSFAASLLSTSACFQAASRQILPHPNPRTSSQTKSSLCPKSPSPPKSSESPFQSPQVLRRCGGEPFATRLRQPCGGEGSEGRALAIPRASGAGWAGAWVARPSRERQTATEPPPRRWHGTDLRSTTAARRTPPTRGATIAAETAAPRGCWPRDPRSGVADKLR